MIFYFILMSLFAYVTAFPLMSLGRALLGGGVGVGGHGALLGGPLSKSRAAQ